MAVVYVLTLAIVTAVMTFKLARNRVAREYSGLLVRFRDRPARRWWRGYGAAAAFIFTHGAGLVVLSVLVAAASAHADLPGREAFYVAGAAVFAAPAVSMVCFYGLLRSFDTAMYEHGLIRGRYVMSWADFSHYERHGDDIVLFVNQAPTIPKAVIRPPDAVASGESIAAMRIPDAPLPTTPVRLTATTLVLSTAVATAVAITAVTITVAYDTEIGAVAGGAVLYLFAAAAAAVTKRYRL